MLARRLASILPPMSMDEALETTKIYSVAGLLSRNGSLLATRPFRAPHHTVSSVALIGGGSIPGPGEVSLAHNGILFLDELPEFPRTALEALRQPLEDRTVTVARAAMTSTFPASFSLVASLNPCPCGFRGDERKKCTCDPFEIRRYMARLSGPLLDRIDMHVEVRGVQFDQLREKSSGEPSKVLRQKVLEARDRQLHRFEGTGVNSNAAMGPKHIAQFCDLDKASEKMVKDAFENRGLSARSYDRVLKLARTIADVQGQQDIDRSHIAQALNYRTADVRG